MRQPSDQIMVRELTVAEVRDWIRELSTPDAGTEIDLADYLLFEDEGIRLRDFERMTDLSFHDLQTMTPTELELLLKRCREANPRFFLVLGRVLTLGRLSIQQRLSMASNKPVHRSRNWFARMFTAGPGGG